jgi:putative ABC transport system permease protein
MLLRLVLRNLQGRKVRTVLTVGAVAVAVFLLAVLHAAVRALDVSVAQAATNRLWVQSAVSLYVDLPLAYETKIAAVPGVKDVCKWQWFGGVYKDRSNFFAQFGVDADSWLRNYPELEIAEGSYEAFMGRRTGCVVGRVLMERFGWRVGQTVPLLGTIFPRVDGSAWEFQIEAVYRSNSRNIDESTFYFHFDYLRESIETGAAAGQPGVGVFMVKMQDDVDPTTVQGDIDTLFANGPLRVQTTTEAEFQRSFITMLGNVPLLLGAIGSGVVFAIFFAVLNSMLLAARERTRDVGIMKALGFSDARVFGVLLAESMLVCALGGLLGLGLALLVDGPLNASFGAMIPGLTISGSTLLFGLLLSLALGAIAGAVPAAGASRIEPVRALRAEA